MSDTEVLIPTTDDDRYDLRLKLRVARAHLKLADAGKVEKVLEAVYLIAMGKAANGRRLNVEPRTRVQAARTLLSSTAALIPRDPLVAVTQNNVTVGVDREAYRRALANPATRRAATVMLRELTRDDTDELEQTAALQAAEETGDERTKDEAPPQGSWGPSRAPPSAHRATRRQA